MVRHIEANCDDCGHDLAQDVKKEFDLYFQFVGTEKRICNICFLKQYNEQTRKEGKPELHIGIGLW